MMDQPTVVRVEYWFHNLSKWSWDESELQTQNLRDYMSSLVRPGRDWYRGGGEILLQNPEKYVRAMEKRGDIARVVDVDTGEVLYTEGADLI